MNEFEIEQIQNLNKIWKLKIFNNKNSRNVQIWANLNKNQVLNNFENLKKIQKLNKIRSIFTLEYN
jgi:hypothetical protein